MSFALIAILLAVCLGLAAGVVAAPTYRLEIKPEWISPQAGYASVAMLPFQTTFPFVVTADTNEGPRSSRVRLFEDGKELGPAHADHPQVEKSGNGAFSHWYAGIRFSASDNSDPRTNGRVYEISAKADLDPIVVRTAVFAAVLCLIGLYLAGGVAARRTVAAGLGVLAVSCVLLINYEFYSLTRFLPLIVPDSGGYLISGNLRGWITPAIFQSLHWVDPTGRIFVPFQLNALLLSFAALSYAVAKVTRVSLLGWAAFFILAFNPAVLSNALFILSESLFIAALCCYVAAALLALRQRSLRWAALAGVAAGLAASIRPVGLSLVLALPVLPLLMPGQRLRALAASTAGALAVLVVSNAPGWIGNERQADTLTGLAVLGQVLHFAEPNTPTKYPELMQKISARIEPIVTWRDAEFPRDYWLKTLGDYNTLLWREAFPEIQAYVEERRRAGDTSLTVNAVATSLALSIIAEKPFAYARLIAAQLYGLWATAYEGGRGPLGPSIVSWTDVVTSAFQNTTTAHSFFGEKGYDLQDATRQIRDGRVKDLWLEYAGKGTRLVLLAGLLLLPALIPALAVVALISLFGRFEPSPVVAAATFCCAQILSYGLALGASQPALDRYSVVLEPVVITILVLVLVAAARAVVRAAGRWRGRFDLSKGGRRWPSRAKPIGEAPRS